MPSNKKHLIYLGKVCLLSIVLSCPSLVLPSRVSLLLGLIGGLFFLISMAVSTMVALSPATNVKKSIVLGFGGRFLVLVLYCFFTVKYLKLEILIFGLGLILPLISLYLYELYLFITYKLSHRN